MLTHCEKNVALTFPSFLSSAVVIFNYIYKQICYPASLEHTFYLIVKEKTVPFMT